MSLSLNECINIVSTDNSTKDKVLEEEKEEVEKTKETEETEKIEELEEPKEIEEKKEEKDNKVTYIPEENMYVFLCPHCSLYVQVKEKDVRCKIFRHAVYKKSNKPIKPHTLKAECERLLKQDLVYGCCKPFKLVRTNGKIDRAEICDYI